MAKGRLRQLLWAVGLCAALTLPAGAAPADSAERTAALPPPARSATIDVGYDLRFWFIPFGHTDYHARFDNGAYKATSYFKTSGLVSVFWQAEIDADADGKIGNHTVIPALYDSYARRSAEKKQRVRLTYEPDGPPKLLAEPTYNITQYPVTDKEQEESVDPMSAIALILTGVTADAKTPCGTVAPVFDGRRRYNIEFSYVKDLAVKLDNKVYAGPVHLCEVHYRQIAGYKPNMLRDKDKWPPIFALIADIPDARAPMGRYTVPVKLWAKTEWGTVTVELSALKVSGDGAKG